MAKSVGRPQWQDITSYSRGQADRIPSTWQLRLTRDVVITITRGHIYDRDNWVMHCRPWFDTWSLQLPSTPENRDEAMAQAVALVRGQINEVVAALREIN